MADIILHLDSNTLWSAIWGSGFEDDPVVRNYLVDYKFAVGTWDKAGSVDVTYIDETDEDKHLTKRLNIDDFANALSKAIPNYHHSPCGGNITTDTDDWDACIADLLLQLALYGKEVWA